MTPSTWSPQRCGMKRMSRCAQRSIVARARGLELAGVACQTVGEGVGDLGVPLGADDVARAGREFPPG
jgi:hypothetical protein